MTPVDTATLAVHLGVTPGQVRLMVHHGQLVIIGRWHTGRRGRPSMWFDLDTLDQQELDHGSGSCVNAA